MGFHPGKNVDVTECHQEKQRKTPYWCVLRRGFSGMIHWPTMNNHPSNPQQPIQQPYVKRTSKTLGILNQEIQR